MSRGPKHPERLMNVKAGSPTSRETHGDGMPYQMLCSATFNGSHYTTFGMASEFALEQFIGITENLGEKANGNSWRFISTSRLFFLASSFSELGSLTRPYFTGKSSGVL